MKAEYVDHMGNDLSVVNAARVSFAKVKIKFEEEDARLIEFLARGCTKKDWDELMDNAYYSSSIEDLEEIVRHIKNQPDHWTPFGHTAITLRMKAPIPIRTQCFKHKQGLVENEESRRYIKSTPELFIPENFRAAPEGSVKQGSGGVHHESDELLSDYIFWCEQMIAVYEDYIERGVCPEQARFLLPQGVQVNWIWTGNLYAFANFFKKRTDSHAQKEIRDLAHEVGQIIEPLYPVSWAALTGGTVARGVKNTL
jgi:thymidylate synthase (FAD)